MTDPKVYPTHRQRSCVNNEGVLLYPSQWYCTKCNTSHFEESLAKYCCNEEK